jgi:hypothetical protein
MPFLRILVGYVIAIVVHVQKFEPGFKNERGRILN